MLIHKMPQKQIHIVRKIKYAMYAKYVLAKSISIIYIYLKKKYMHAAIIFIETYLTQGNQ